jgi:pyruvate kinase
VVAWAVAHAAVQAAEDLGVAAIVCPTQGGTTARRVAAFRPSMPIAGIASAAGVLGKLSLAWGVRPTAMDDTDGRVADRRTPAEGRSSEGAGGTMSNDDQVRQAVRAVRRCDMARKGELIAVVSASSGKRAGATDTVRIVRV